MHNIFYPQLSYAWAYCNISSDAYDKKYKVLTLLIIALFIDSCNKKFSWHYLPLVQLIQEACYHQIISISITLTKKR